MSYCPAKDVTEQAIKRANEKKRKNLATKGAYKTAKARNLFTVPVEFKTRVRAGDDESFIKTGEGRYRKVYE